MIDMPATIAICVVIAAAVVFGVLHYRKTMRSGCCGGDSDAAPKRVKVQDRDLSHYPYEKILDIGGMTCQNCATHVQNALNSLNGVYSKVDLGRKKAVVHLKEDLPEPMLRKAVANVGYTVGTVRVVAQ
jgi:Cation transport ATPase